MGAEALVGVESVSRAFSVRASFAQQRLWFFEQLESGRHLYNVAFAWRLRGALDRDHLRSAVRALGERHEGLRTSFQLIDGVLHQVIAPEPMLQLHEIDLTETTEREKEVERRLREEAEYAFDLSRGPLIRALLMRLGDIEHVLAITMHHAINDAWSMAIILRELRHIYASHCRSEPISLPELSIQYADYSEWQRESLASGELLEQLDRWKQRLAGAPPVLELPSCRRPPTARTREARTHSFRVPPAVVEQLRIISKREGATLFMTVLAAFAATLHRSGTHDDLVIGSPVTGRIRPELQDIVGCFLNMLALRLDVSGNPTFSELLARVRDVALQAYTDAEVPFDLLVEELNPPRDLGRDPLVQVAFTLLEGEGSMGLELPGLTAEPIAGATEAAKFDLLLDAVPQSDGGLNASIVYAVELYEDADMRRLARHLVRILEQVAAQPGIRIGDIGLLTESERQALVQGTGETPLRPDRTLHQLISEQAARTPDRAAATMGSRTLTYRELWAGSTRMAAFLSSLGVGSGALVAVHLERSPEMLIALLGILRAGAAYVPLDPTNPSARIQSILDDAQPMAIVTSGGLAGRLPAASVPVLRLDTDWKRIARAEGSPPDDVTSRGLAYVLYTSGTTGTPKGVQVEHRSLVNLLCAMVDELELTRDDRVLAATPLAFDIAAVELYAALLVGARIVLCDEDTAADGAALGALLERARVTLMQATPSRWQLLIQAGWKGSDQLRALCGGEVLTERLRDDLLQRTACLWNGYGPTESTVYSTIWRADAGPVLIGEPIANTRVYVVDAHGHLAPPGVPGELWIGGTGVAGGYLNRPQLTEERFVADQFAGSGERLYRTGDIVRRLDDGSLEYRGRGDAQVKIRGYRIELEEIESVLRRHPAIDSAAVVVHHDDSLGPRLVAYVVAATIPAPSTSEVRSFAKLHLPEYMVPASVTTLEAVPLTASGKLDRKALAGLAAPNPGSSRQVAVPAATATEAMVAAVWEEMFAQHNITLDMARVGVEADFFETGGQSLLGAMLLARLHERSGVRLPLRSLFERPTVRGLATAIDDAPRTAAEAIPANHPDKRTLLSPREKAHLEHVSRSGGSQSVWNVPLYRRLLGPLDMDAFERSVAQLAARHEALRMSFPRERLRFARRISAEPGQILVLDDLSALPANQRNQRALQIAAEELARPFDLAHGPLIRIRLLRLRADDHVMLGVLHHLICDDWTLNLIARDLSELYASVVEGRAHRLPDLRIQYGDYLAWRSEDKSGQFASQAAYWTRQLADLPRPLDVFPDRARRLTPRPEQRTAQLALPPEAADRVRAVAREHEATTYTVLLAAFTTVLSRYTGQTDVLVSTTTANRTRPELHDTVGALYNELLLRTDLGGDPTFRELVGRVRGVILDALANEEVEFSFSAPSSERDEHRRRINVTYRSATDVTAFIHDLALPGLAVEAFGNTTSHMPLDLVVVILDNARGGLDIRFTYRADLFEASTITRIGAHFQALLDAALEDVDRPVSALRMLTEADRRSAGAAKDHREPRETLMPLIDKRLRSCGDDVAAIDGSSETTFGEIDERARRLAQALVAMGVGRGSIVGVATPPSAQMGAILLGVLRSGATILLLGPERLGETEAERLARIGVTTVLTRGRAGRFGDGGQLIDLDALPGSPGDATPLPTLHPEDMAYVVGDMAGRTGAMCAVTHAGLHWLVQGVIGREVRSTDVMARLSDVSSENLLLEIFATMAKGARLTDIPSGSGPVALLQELKRNRATVLLATPSLVKELAVCPPDSLAPLRLVIITGPGSPTEAVSAIAAGLGRKGTVMQLRGPTTGATLSGAYLIEDAAPADATVITGRPLSSPCMALDDRGNLVPIGTPGELCIGGVRAPRPLPPDAGAPDQRLAADPLDPEGGGTLYRTGCRARFLESGRIEILSIPNGGDAATTRISLDFERPRPRWPWTKKDR